MGSPKDFAAMIQLVTSKQIRPVLDRSYPLSEIKEALVHMEKGENFGKITLQIP